MVLTFPNWLIPVWILGAPLLLIIIDRMMMPNATRIYSDTTRPLPAAAPYRT